MLHTDKDASKKSLLLLPGPEDAVMEVLPARAGQHYLITKVSNGKCKHTLITPGRKHPKIAAKGEKYNFGNHVALCFDPATIADSQTMPCPGCTVTVDWFNAREIRCVYPTMYTTERSDLLPSVTVPTTITMVYHFSNEDVNPRRKLAELNNDLFTEEEKLFSSKKAQLRKLAKAEENRFASVPGKICGELYHTFWPMALDLISRP